MPSTSLTAIRNAIEAERDTAGPGPHPSNVTPNTLIVSMGTNALYICKYSGGPVYAITDSGGRFAFNESQQAPTRTLPNNTPAADVARLFLGEFHL
ncbi:hypothetical protein BIV57_17760 [Mangrovactinospora gilvigrisea]|uniref:Uncharacterized protein n=1 Tax=Mangrovactinospora gilvigrisea TaxID=1428644 RepID=A0A1J7BBU5_9ACTN|nr:hypothetical protein [Mangrovactinospora gilvigrisea]OIV36159.1 hypothetical protein BIV57_17760 [Mangrovactinospora gilvigrisea]